MKRYVKELAADAMKEIDKQTNLPKPLQEENKGRMRLQSGKLSEGR